VPTKIKCCEVTLSANGSDTTSINIDQGKTFTIYKIAIRSTGAFKVTAIKVVAGDYYITTGDMYKEHFQERGNHLLLMENPIVVQGSTDIEVSVTDTSGSTNTVSFAFIGDER